MKIRIWLAAALLAWSAVATADIIFFDVTTGNAAIAGFAGPYAHVVVDLTDSTHATITFTSLLSGGNIYLLGGQGAAAVNVNATSWSIGSFAASNGGTGFTPGPLSDDGSAHEDGWGVFNQTIDSFDGYTHSSDQISFILTDTGGTWASASNVLAANAGGSFAAAHIFVTTSPANASNGALVTGFAAGTGVPGGPPPQQIPEPGMLVLLSIGLLSLTGMRRRRS